MIIHCKICGGNFKKIKGRIRELHEELLLHRNAELNSKIVGFINDTSDDLGKNHLGIYCLMDVSKPIVEIIDKEIQQGHFLEYEWLEEHFEALDAWGKIAFDALKNFKSQK